MCILYILHESTYMYTYARDVSFFLSLTLFPFPLYLLFSPSLLSLFFRQSYVYVSARLCLYACMFMRVCVRVCVQWHATHPFYLHSTVYRCVLLLRAFSLPTRTSLLVSLTSTVFLSLSSIQRVCGTGSVCTRAQICACRLVGDREFWMDLERSEICQGDGMGRYRFRKGGTSRKTLMEKCISSITTQEKQRGSILETGTPFSMYMFVCTRTRAKTESIYEIACDLYARTLLSHLKIAFEFFFFSFFLSSLFLCIYRHG